MARGTSPIGLGTSVVVGVLAVFLALPDSIKAGLPQPLQHLRLHYGLDLAGGTQLDFRISEQEMQQQIANLTAEIARREEEGASPEILASLRQQVASIHEQQRNIVEAIRVVLERRINALGVSEATITPSYVGKEKHLLVECPGLIDPQQCIATVGKTINLEFKEEFTQTTPEYEAAVRANADAAYRRITASGQSLRTVGEDLSGELGVSYEEDVVYFRDTLPKGLEALWTKSPRDGVLRYQATVTVPVEDETGNTRQRDIPGIFLVELLEPRSQTGRLVNEAPKAFSILAAENTALRHVTHGPTPVEQLPPRIVGALRTMTPGDLKTVTMEDGTSRILFLRSFVPGREEMDVSHILIAYAGAASADPSVKRTKQEALALAQELKRSLDAGADFAQLARTRSDGPSAADGGRLGTISRGSMVPSFEQAAFSLPEGAVSDPVETPFGFHLIRSDRAPAVTSDTVGFEELIIPGDAAGTQAQELLARLQRGDVKSMEDVLRLRTLFFSLLPTGWKDTPLDGKHFRSATVTLDPVTNIPVVQILFDDEGGKIFQELTKRNVGKRIAIFVGGQLVSAPVVQSEISGGSAVITGSRNFDEARLLAQDLNTGAIPAPIFLAGQRTVEATLGADALRTSVQAGLIGLALLMVYMLVFYRVLGLLADIALVVYGVLYLAMMKLPLFLFSSQYVVLTLAGMAGIILSTGMAVDANVLIFERIKEELRKGKMLTTAMEIGFQKAWPSIRDGNVSTLITCVILFTIGTSIVRGFAITLMLGVVLSMFTAITVTKWMARRIAETPLGARPELFGGTPTQAV